MNIAARCVHGVGVCLIPKPENDHRPLALRHKPLAAVSGLLIAAKLAAIGIIGLTPQTAELSTITSATIVQQTNAERVSRGLDSLEVSSLLTSAAQQKAQHMLEEDYFAHISPSGVTPWFWMAKVGYTYTIAGENLAIDFSEAEDVVAAWIASPSHKDNMFHREYTHIGVGVRTGEFQGGTSIVVVQMFGRPQTAGITTTATPTPQPSKAPTPTPTPSTKPTPSATPTPTLTPLPAPSDTTPPRTPRIALVGDVQAVKDTITLSIEGEGGSQVDILVNNQTRQEFTLSSSGQLEATLSVAGLDDGTLVLRALASDGAGNQSELSQPLAVAKDTVGPALAAEELQFFIAPAFDTAQIHLHAAATDFTLLQVLDSANQVLGEQERAGWLPIASADQSFTIRLADAAGNRTTIENIRLQPAFSTDPTLEEISAPATVQQFTRRLTVASAAALLVLLLLAILIRIRVQHPAMIGHASLVIVLAGILWLL